MCTMGYGVNNNASTGRLKDCPCEDYSMTGETMPSPKLILQM